MKYNKIFWLENDITIVGNIVAIDGKNKDEEMKSILERTVFAHDYESGKKIVSEQDFDLYVLDADFPNVIRKQNYRINKKHLCKLAVEGPFKKRPIGSDKSRDVNFNGIRFYWELLRDKSGDKIMCTANGMAQCLGARLGIGGYQKGDGTMERYIKWLAPLDINELIGIWEKHFDIPSLPEWLKRNGIVDLNNAKLGGAREVLEEYLNAKS